MDGHLAYKRGDLPAAELIFREFNAKHPNDSTRHDLARVLRDEGKLLEAKELMKLVVHPDHSHRTSEAADPFTLAEYADLCERTGDASGFKEALLKSGARSKYEFYMQAGLDARRWDAYKAAAEYYSRALAERPGDRSAISGLSMSQLELKRDAARSQP